jgi:hypothetical protein
MRRPILAFVAQVALVAACGDGPPSGRDAVIDAWKSAGIAVTAMAPSQAHGGDCQAGTAGGVEVTLCTFADAKAASAAQPAALTTIGDATGAALAQGAMLLVVTDRRKVDPAGRTINQLTKAFRGRS